MARTMTHTEAAFRIAKTVIATYAELVQLGVADEISFSELLGITTVAVAEKEDMNLDYLTDLVASAVAIEWEKISPSAPQEEA